MPLVDSDEIKLAQTLTTQAQNAYRLSASSIPVSGLEDITDALSLLKNKITLCVEDVKNIYGILCDARKFSSFLHKYAENEDKLFEFTHKLFVFADLEQKIQDIFDSGFNVKESASIELKSLYQAQRDTNENLKHTISDLMKILNLPLIFKTMFIPYVTTVLFFRLRLNLKQSSRYCSRHISIRPNLFY